MESRALIGHLVGYDSTNIFRIWLPESHTVLRTRDVVFRSNTRYDGSTVYVDLRVARTVKTVLDIADYEGEIEELEISKLLELSAPFSSHGTEMPEEEDRAHDQLIEELLQQSANGDQILPTPGSTPERTIDLRGSSFSPATIERRSRAAGVEEEISLPKGYEPVQGGQAAPNRRENDAPRRTNPATTSDNIVADKRTRGSAHAAYLSTFAVAYLSTFASAINLLKWKVDVLVVVLEWDAALNTLFTSRLFFPSLRSSQLQLRLIAQVPPALNSPLNHNSCNSEVSQSDS
jgi:hypothetical protein